jgi:hypothetical protein
VHGPAAAAGKPSESSAADSAEGGGRRRRLVTVGARAGGRPWVAVWVRRGRSKSLNGTSRQRRQRPGVFHFCWAAPVLVVTAPVRM